MFLRFYVFATFLRTFALELRNRIAFVFYIYNVLSVVDVRCLLSCARELQNLAALRMSQFMLFLPFMT